MGELEKAVKRSQAWLINPAGLIDKPEPVYRVSIVTDACDFDDKVHRITNMLRDVFPEGSYRTFTGELAL